MKLSENWKTRKGSRLLVLGAVISFFPASAQMVTINGIVKDSQGIPMENVRVSGLTRSTSRAVTDRDGQFSLPHVGRALLFEHPDYAPKFVLTVPRKPILETRLDRRTPLEVRVPACRGAKLSARDPFRSFKYQLPRGLKAVRSRDIDYSVVSVYSKKNETICLRIWERVIGTGIPDDQFFADVKGDITTIPIDLDGSKGYDIRVVKTTGNVSRSFGVFYTIVHYDNVSPEMARKFDAVITSLCYY